MAFSTGVYEHPQFELLYLLNELYKGSSLTLSIDFLILAILYSPRLSQRKTIRLFSLKHRACISTLLCIAFTYGYIDHSNHIDFL
jgi:hypothetical protein